MKEMVLRARHLDKGLYQGGVWEIRENTALRDNLLLSESLFALANGYFGTRGTLEEGAADHCETCEGTYLNGVHGEEEIPYGERAYGFATHNHTMIQVPNGKSIRLFVGEEEFLPLEGGTTGHVRRLDMRRGMLEREVDWEAPSGRKIRLVSRRFVSLANRHLMALEYVVTAVNFSGVVRIHSCLDSSYACGEEKDDPRAGNLSLGRNLELLESGAGAGGSHFLHKIRNRKTEICSAAREVFLSPGAVSVADIDEDGRAGAVYDCELREKGEVRLHKYVVYVHGGAGGKVRQEAEKVLSRAVDQGFDKALQEHCRELGKFWDNADVVISGDPELQQGLRFNLMQVFCSAGKDGQSNIGAKGQTGPGYDGHYFWDTEIYVIPFLLFTMPDIARKLLEYRHGILPRARERARQMAHETGALYAWRTIGGEECSAFFPAGTAQYHINAAIAYAIRHYFDVTGDWDFMVTHGAEMLFETARIWPGLGHFSERHGGQFCIYEVTGPDEYTAMVNNNFYTNAMAQMHLETAVETARQMARTAPEAFRDLCRKISLKQDEIGLWATIAAKMYLPYDETLKINPQDDSFLDKPRWDFENVPRENYPLLLHYHPLVIYRHQVLKQADVVLAMFLLGERFPHGLKQRNLEYYEPLTTHDSTLSSCIYGIVSAEVGKQEQACDFFQDNVRMDLDNHHGNTEYGLHTACMAGSWMSVTYGFAGMRVSAGELAFDPFLPAKWEGYGFLVRFRGRKLHVAVGGGEVVYTLIVGDELRIRHGDEIFSLSGAQPVTAKLSRR